MEEKIGQEMRAAVNAHAYAAKLQRQKDARLRRAKRAAAMQRKRLLTVLATEGVALALGIVALLSPSKAVPGLLALMAAAIAAAEVGDLLLTQAEASRRR